jgi:putative intracellular protease/amidase
MHFRNDVIRSLREIALGREPSRGDALDSLLDGLDVAGVRALRRSYLERYHRDPEIDIRRFGLGQSPAPSPELVNRMCARLARPEHDEICAFLEALSGKPTLTLDDRRQYFVAMARVGFPFGREALAKRWAERTNSALEEARRALEARMPIPSEPVADPQKSVAFFLSEIAAQLQELMDWALPLLDAGISLQGYTPNGRPAGLQHDSLLPSFATGKLGFGCPKHLLLDGPVRRAFDRLMGEIRPMAQYDPSNHRGGVYGVGGLGTDRDLTHEPRVHAMVARAFEARVPILAICHAPTVLAQTQVPKAGGGSESLLAGIRAIGLPNALESYAIRSGRVASVFMTPTPPIDVGRTLADAGARVDWRTDLASLAKQNRIVRDEKNGVPIITGVGPLAARTIGQAHRDLIMRGK